MVSPSVDAVGTAQRAFSELMAQHGGLIYSVCRYRLAPSFGFAIEDAASETALRIYRAIERQALAGEDIRCNRSFIRLVATRTAITVFNQHIREIEKRRRLGGEMLVAAHAIDSAGAVGRYSELIGVADLDDVELAVLLDELPRLLGRLRQRDQALLRLYYLSSPPLAWDAIGERLEMRPAAARQAGRRALKKLSRMAHEALNELRGGGR